MIRSIHLHVRVNPDGTVTALTTANKKNPMVTVNTEAELFTCGFKLLTSRLAYDILQTLRGQGFVYRPIQLPMSKIVPGEVNVRVSLGKNRYIAMDDFITEFGMDMWELIRSINPTIHQTTRFVETLRKNNRERLSPASRP